MPNKINIIVLEDDPDDRESIDQMLASMGISNYNIVSTRKDFIAMLGEEIHICILDDTLSDGGNGLEILEAVNSKNQGSVTIMYTGQKSLSIAKEYWNKGSYKFVGKWENDHLYRLEVFVKEAFEIAKKNAHFINWLKSQGGEIK